MGFLSNVINGIVRGFKGQDRRAYCVFDDDLAEKIAARQAFNAETRAVEKEYAFVLEEHKALVNEINQKYAVAKELKLFTSAEMDNVVNLCKRDIGLIPQYLRYLSEMERAILNELSVCTEIDDNDTMDFYHPKYMMCFARLAMIYEKRGDYDSALNVCDDSVRLGLGGDGTSGGMVGRMARLTRKKNQQRARIT